MPRKAPPTTKSQDPDQRLKGALDTIRAASTARTNIAYDPEKISDIIAYLYQYCDQNSAAEQCLKLSHSPCLQDQIEQQKQELVTLYGIIDAIPANIYWKNTEGQYLGLNKACLAVTPFTNRNDIIGKTLSEVYKDAPSNDFIEKVENIDLGVMTHQKLYTQEENGVDKKGSPATYLSLKQPLYTNHKVTGMVGVSIDITQNKILEQRLHRSNEAKNEFIRNMGHDLRTPITGMMGIINEIKQNTQCDQILHKTELLQQVTAALLSFANAALQNINMTDSTAIDTHTVFNIQQTIDQTIQMLSANIQQKGLRIHISYANNFPGHVLGLKSSIERVLLNIISNAVKFTDKGSISVDIKTNPPQPHPNENMQILITITDTGIGIAKDQHAFIFEKFTRINPSYTGQSAGTGLGLHATEKVLQQMGGSIYIDSKLHHGTRVNLVIPAQMPTRVPPKPAQPKQQKNPDIDHDRMIHILIVEDNVLALKMAENMLRHHLHCTIHAVNHGHDAVEAVTHHDYDLILMDIGLPDIDGIEVSRLIRNVDDPKKAHIPIIALSGHSDDELVERCLATKINRVLCKPLLKEHVFELFELL